MNIETQQINRQSTFGSITWNMWFS